jgi:hypothetical protein
LVAIFALLVDEHAKAFFLVFFGHCLVWFSVFLY